MTSDKQILADIRGIKIELKELPVQHRTRQTFNDSETKHLQNKIHAMLNKSIIAKVLKDTPGQIVWPERGRLEDQIVNYS